MRVGLVEPARSTVCFDCSDAPRRDVCTRNVGDSRTTAGGACTHDAHGDTTRTHYVVRASRATAGSPCARCWGADLPHPVWQRCARRVPK